MNKTLVKSFYFFSTSIFIILIHFPFVFAKVKMLDSPASVRVTDSTKLNATGNKDFFITEKLCSFEGLELAKFGLSRQAFDYAIRGFHYLVSKGKLNDNQILSIIDFSLPSSKKRLFILDLTKGKILFNTYVAHGRNSGRELATQFSNKQESYQSSLGFYVTQETYTGKHGFSLRLQGQETGINDNARSREIVMHSAPYVDEKWIHNQGFIGRSLGCPALPENMHKPIIEKIKNGTCLFLYSPDKYYTSHSTILQKA